MKSISQKIASIEREIPQNVRLIAITKQVGIEAIREAYAAGIRDFGENRLQEAIAKQEALRDLKDIQWHFIGHIQKNKARKIVEHFSWIHSLDSLALAQRINRLAAELKLMPKVFVQVKILPDPNKYGWSAAELLSDLKLLRQCNRLDFCGLMTILPWGLSAPEALNAFQEVANLSTKIRASNDWKMSLPELSMGMSGDYKLAIEAGATQIRLGRTIFGERQK